MSEPEERYCGLAVMTGSIALQKFFVSFFICIKKFDFWVEVFFPDPSEKFNGTCCPNFPIFWQVLE